jgi:hypothetical protein
MKKMILALALLLILPFMMGVTSVLSAEKGKVAYRNVWHATDVQVEGVPDVEGHSVYLLKAKGITFNEKWGNAVGTLNGIAIAIKGVWSYEGYMRYTFSDGSTITERYKGADTAPGVGEGGGDYVQGTGRFKGIKGDTKWNVYTVGPGQFYADLEVEYTLP